VSRKTIHLYQRKAYMNAREIGLNQAKAAYVAEISERTGQRIESGEHQQNRGKVAESSIQDPLDGLWEKELEPMLRKEPRLKPMTLFEHLQDTYPGKYPQVLRTLQQCQQKFEEEKQHLEPLGINRTPSCTGAMVLLQIIVGIMRTGGHSTQQSPAETGTGRGSTSQRKSLLITANQPFSQWESIFPDSMMTVAAVDRLIHHGVIFEIKSKSYRRQVATTRSNKSKAS
jgi:hypothetical protein